MGLCLGHESALRYWLTKTGDEVMPDIADGGAFFHATVCAREVKAGHLPFGAEEQRPLHLLIPDRRLEHEMSGVVAHVMSNRPPAGSFYDLWGDNTVASPELAFTQIAASRPLVEVVRAGCYLCGTFSIGDEGRGYTGERPQVATLESLRSYVATLPPRTRGRRRAHEALEHIIEGMASPMEVFLGMAYGMPPKLGGFGPFTMHANQRIEIDDRVQRLLGSRYLRGDLYLPDFYADLEFDSREYHTGQYRLDHTLARRNALEAMGVKTISATYGQLDTFEKYETFTWMLRRRLGLDQPVYSYEERQAQMGLYDALLSASKPLF